MLPGHVLNGVELVTHVLPPTFPVSYSESMHSGNVLE